MRFGRGGVKQPRHSATPRRLDPTLKIIGRSWSFRENDEDGRGWRAKWMQSTTTVRPLHPPLNAVHDAGRAARGHDTSQSRRITWRERARRAEGREGPLLPLEGGERARGEKEDEREREEGKGRERGGREACACLGAKSWASRAQAWPRLTLRSSRSEVILEHEPPSGSQPPTSRESPTRRLACG